MMKVIIADDEVKVCQLIYKLIDWNELDMEVVGISHNGIDALEQVKEKKPDIVITDIRMPGYDGIELIRLCREINEYIDFIIISGYAQFEYAQKVIKYGVCDYLLKPIKKEELINNLEKMKEKYADRMNKLTNEEKLKARLKVDIEKLRSRIFTEILLNKSIQNLDLKIQNINEEYHYKFQEGNFQAITIKIDLGFKEIEKNKISILKSKATDIFNNHLFSECFDLEIYFQDSVGYCILNYKESCKKIIRKKLKLALDELLIQKNIFMDLEVTLGIGSIVEDLSKLYQSFRVAYYAMEERILLGRGKLIENVEIRDNHQYITGVLSELNKSMEKSIEILDKDLLIASVDEFKKMLVENQNISGEEIIDSVNEIFKIYVILVRNNMMEIENKAEFSNEFNIYINNCGSVEEIFEYLKNKFLKSLDKIIEGKRQADTKPIRVAKEYIKQNYMKQISLEEVSSFVGFNSSYFSHLFKKESGKNFLEYLSETRMNKAKEFLKETNLSIAVICEKVGYCDIKHFTKSFKKIAGIKPNEYRKLYS
jgi:two-component system, response regulator YesN